MLCRWYWLPGALAKIRSPAVAFSMPRVGGGAAMTGRAISRTLSTQKTAVPVWPEAASPDHILRTTPEMVSILGALGLMGRTTWIHPPLVGMVRGGSQFWE